MKKIVILLVVQLMVFAFTIPASAGGNGPVKGNNLGGGVGPGDGTGPIGGLGPFGGNGSDGNGVGTGVGPGDGTGPIGDLGPFGSKGSFGKGAISSPGRQGQRINFTVNGEISAIGTDTVTIIMTCGNKTAQVYIGSQVTVTVTPQTRYNMEVGTTDTQILFSDLLAGQLVSLNGTVVDNIWTVRRITVVSALDCIP
jgi:hypothetical protein